MTRYSFDLPNTATITGTEAVGSAFEALAIQIIWTVMGGDVVLGMMIGEVWCESLLWLDEGSRKALRRVMVKWPKWSVDVVSVADQGTLM
jgi:hypothetical protein